MSALVATLFTLLALIATVLATATPYWLRGDDNNDIYMGLWKSCGPVQRQIVCLSITTVPEFMAATRELETIGIVLITIAGAIGLLKLTHLDESNSMLRLAGVCAFLSGLSTITGTLVFLDKYDKADAFGAGVSPYAGIGLAFVAGFSAAIGGALFFYSTTMLPKHTKYGKL